jgi:predicted GNAT family N-acyltransferase
LSSNSIPIETVIEQYRTKLPPAYRSIPTVLLGRLAVDIDFQKMKTGKLLLADALKRSYDISKNLGAFAVIVDPLDDNVRKFYSKYGFITMSDNEKMFIPMNTVKQLFE